MKNDIADILFKYSVNTSRQEIKEIALALSSFISLG